MGAKTEIAWCDATWNPVRGCSMAKGSETGGCLNCYAARMAARNLPELKSPTTGESFARILPTGPRWTGKVELIESQLTLPLKWRKPKRIFVNSMSDLFHEALTDEQIDRVFAVMRATPWHTYQVLTKRPERMLAYLNRLASIRMHPWKNEIDRGRWSVIEDFTEDTVFLYRCPWPLPNVWLGISCENQETTDARIPLLLQTPAAIRFVSYEPALGPVDFMPWLRRICSQCGQRFDHGACGPTHAIIHHMRGRTGNRISQIIFGGESGPGARPCDIDWARSTLEQCQQAEVPFFMKQVGAKPFLYSHGVNDNWPYGFPLKSRKGGDMAEWTEDLRVRQFPEVHQ